jgi:hypothetical protein
MEFATSVTVGPTPLIEGFALLFGLLTTALNTDRDPMIGSGVVR